MKIIYRHGDILDTDTKYIAHCVNAQGKMASGVAKAIRSRYPKAYDDYIDTYNTSGLQLGKVICSTNVPHDILHIVGQKYYGYDKATYVDYVALRRAFATINKNVKSSVSLPLIGCGLAGGNWQIVSAIIEEEFTNIQPIVYSLNDEVLF